MAAAESDKSQPAPSPSNRSWLTETAAIAATPLAGYMIAYSYIMGYLHHFQVPNTFLTIQLFTILSVALLLVVVLIFIFLLLETFLSVLPTATSPYRKAMLFTLPILALGVACLVILGWNWRGAAIVVGFAALPLIAEWISRRPVPVPAGVHSILREWIERTLPLTRAIVDRVHIGILLGVLFGVFVIWIANGLGSRNAARQTQFMVPRTHPNAVVVANDSEYFVCCFFDESEKRLLPSYVVLKNSSDAPIMFDWKSIGPLEAVTLQPAARAKPASSP